MVLASAWPFSRDYRLGKILGRGATGVVFAAEQRPTGLPVAVKVFSATFEDAETLRIKREIRLHSTLRHPNATGFVDAGTVLGRAYLVLELARGGTLKQRLAARGRLPAAEALRIMRGVLAGLQACHAAGIVHRDLKPDNVLLDGSGSAKLGDLGAAKSSTRPVQLTGQGVIVGTLRYMSPEQLAGGPADARSDVYAAGLILHELVTGEVPFASLGRWGMLFPRRIELPPDPSLSVPGLPRFISRAILAALAPDPADRPGSAAELAGLLADGDDAPRQAARRPASPRRPAPFPSRATFCARPAGSRVAALVSLTALALAFAIRLLTI